MSYDYIITGAGPAGCVLANRLSADPKRKVALIEAGGADHRSFKVRAPGACTPSFLRLVHSSEWFAWPPP